MFKFLKSPKKTIFIIGILIILLIIAFVLIKFNFFTAKNNEQGQSKDLVSDYQTNTKQILNQFVADRKNLAANQSASATCQNLLNATLKKILDLTVPSINKELHLKLVVWLDQELQNCQQLSTTSLKFFEEQWQKFTTSYSWLKE